MGPIWTEMGLAGVVTTPQPYCVVGQCFTSPLMHKFRYHLSAHLALIYLRAGCKCGEEGSWLPCLAQCRGSGWHSPCKAFPKPNEQSTRINTDSSWKQKGLGKTTTHNSWNWIYWPLITTAFWQGITNEIRTATAKIITIIIIITRSIAKDFHQWINKINLKIWFRTLQKICITDLDS